MSTSYLRRHWLIPVLQNFRQRFFGFSVSDHGIVWFDIWPKCKLYCVLSLRSIIAGWDILFTMFYFSIYFLKAWFLVEKVRFLVIIFSARKWRECRILHHLPQSFWGPLKAPRPPAVGHSLRGKWPQVCVHIILGKLRPCYVKIFNQLQGTTWVVILVDFKGSSFSLHFLKRCKMYCCEIHWSLFCKFIFYTHSWWVFPRSSNLLHKAKVHLNFYTYGINDIGDLFVAMFML